VGGLILWLRQEWEQKVRIENDSGNYGAFKSFSSHGVKVHPGFCYLKPLKLHGMVAKRAFF
jgi:hypothetical protein